MLRVAYFEVLKLIYRNGSDELTQFRPSDIYNHEAADIVPFMLIVPFFATTMSQLFPSSISFTDSVRTAYSSPAYSGDSAR